jgi:hypothetical protein
MDLGLFIEGTPQQKPWLNITANSITALSVSGGPSLAPLTSGQYSQTSTVTVSNTLLASLSAGSTAVGSLTIPPLPVGSVVKIAASGAGGSTVGGSINYALYVDGKQATTTTTFGANYGTNVATQINANVTIGSATASANFMVVASTHSSNGNFQPTITWDRTISHTIDIFMIASAADPSNGFVCSSFVVELSNS